MKKKIILINKKINYNFNILKKINSGLVLKGWEVKSIKKKKVNIEKSYITITKNLEIYLKNINITPVNNSKYNNNKLNRNIKLLLKKKEIINLYNIFNKKKNISIVPLSIYLKLSLIKIEIAKVEGKKKIDKRDLIKNRDWLKKKIYIEKNKKYYNI